jgi:hypothetical protein
MNAIVQESSATVPGVFAGDAVAFLQTIYKDPRIPLPVRIDAAAKAARFERPASTTNGTPDAKELFTVNIIGSRGTTTGADATLTDPTGQRHPVDRGSAEL